MEWAREASVRWKPRPYVWCAWERERGDSLPHRQKKWIAHRVLLLTWTYYNLYIQRP